MVNDECLSLNGAIARANRDATDLICIEVGEDIEELTGLLDETVGSLIKAELMCELREGDRLRRLQ